MIPRKPPLRRPGHAVTILRTLIKIARTTLLDAGNNVPIKTRGGSVFTSILVPVDLGHIGALEKALDVAADLGQAGGATVTYVGVTTSAPTEIAHNPEEFGQKLSAFAEEQGLRRGIKTAAKAYTSHDPATDLDKTLLGAIAETGADLVVMGTHVPGLADRLWASHGNHIATHAAISVFLVR